MKHQIGDLVRYRPFNNHVYLNARIEEIDNGLYKVTRPDSEPNIFWITI